MEKTKFNWATLSFITGLVSILLWELSIIPITAIVSGIVALIKKQDIGWAIIGLILGIIFLIVDITHQ